MAKDKDVISEKSGNWDTTGDKHMFGWRGTGTQEPGQSAQEGTGPKNGIAPKAGGNTAFVSSTPTNKFGAGTADPGCSSASGARQEGFAHGGKTHMFGNRGSQRAEPA